MCGIVAVVGHPQAAALVLRGLGALQHRGQQSVGLAVGNGQVLHPLHAMGLVGPASSAWQDRLPHGDVALGHVRYATVGADLLGNAQPLVSGQGLAALAHNGQLTNAAPLQRSWAIPLPAAATDTAVILGLLARQPTAPLATQLAATLPLLRGAYALAAADPAQVVVARDPHGWRPLLLGALPWAGGTAWVAASETVALEACGATLLREVAAGEVVTLTAGGLHSATAVPPAPTRKACIFEQVYFASPDSLLAGQPIAAARRRAGTQLAHEAPALGADGVVAVPDSGVAAAAGFAHRAALPLVEALQRTVVEGRAFLQPSPLRRTSLAQRKLTAGPAAVCGRSLVVVDDSLVRGTTAREVLALLRSRGARALHLRIASPPVRWPCWYGIDTPQQDELVAASRDLAALATWLGADSVGYLSLDGLVGASGQDGWCTACFDGAYPLPRES